MSVRAMMSYLIVEYCARVGLPWTRQEESENALIKVWAWRDLWLRERRILSRKWAVICQIETGVRVSGNHLVRTALIITDTGTPARSAVNPFFVKTLHLLWSRIEVELEMLQTSSRFDGAWSLCRIVHMPLCARSCMSGFTVHWARTCYACRVWRAKKLYEQVSRSANNCSDFSSTESGSSWLVSRNPLYNLEQKRLRHDQKTVLFTPPSRFGRRFCNIGTPYTHVDAGKLRLSQLRPHATMIRTIT